MSLLQGVEVFEHANHIILYKIVHSIRDTIAKLHEMSEPIFWEKKKEKNIINLLSAKISKSVLKVIL